MHLSFGWRFLSLIDSYRKFIFIECFVHGRKIVYYSFLFEACLQKSSRQLTFTGSDSQDDGRIANMSDIRAFELDVEFLMNRIFIDRLKKSRIWPTVPSVFSCERINVVS
jgi:hypothetical protein